jgi:hypothetical protein
MSRDPETILLCSLRFWTGAGRGKPSTTPTLRKGVRLVARKQGVTPAELNKAERQLVKGGLATRPGAGTIALTDKGRTVSNSHCKRIELLPWDWKVTYQDPPGQLDGARRKKRSR